MLYLLIFIVLLGMAYLDYRGYINSEYFKETNYGYFKIRTDSGLYGEYLTHKALDKTNGIKMILANVYIPKADGTTTEIDLLMIHETGLYCIESKNYSGWIFGDEKNQYWTQSLQNKQKNKFYNPVRQNAGHIKHLKEHLKGRYDAGIESVIVFSERCELKKVTVNTETALVVKREHLTRILNRHMAEKAILLPSKEIAELYMNLKNCCNKSDAEKLAHIETIKRNSAN